MTVLYVPLPTPNTPKLIYKTILDGNEYKFYFQWMIRNGSGWHLSIYDKEDIIIIDNVRLVPWFDLVSAVPQGRLPSGQLGLVCLSQHSPNAPEITLANLSTDFVLIYVTST